MSNNALEENYLILKYGTTKNFEGENKDYSELTLAHIWLYIFLLSDT